MGLDLPTLVFLCWVGSLAIGRHWGIFTGIGLCWVDSESLAGISPSSLGVIHRRVGWFNGVGRCWVCLAHVGPACVGPSSLGEFTTVGCRWVVLITIGLDSPGLVLQLLWFPSPLSPRVLLLHHFVLPSSPTSFPLLLPPPFLLCAHIPLKGEGWLMLQPRF